MRYTTNFRLLKLRRSIDCNKQIEKEVYLDFPNIYPNIIHNNTSTDYRNNKQIKTVQIMHTKMKN